MMLTTGMLIPGKISTGVRTLESTPRSAIRIASTMKVYGRRSASRTIHTAWLLSRAIEVVRAGRRRRRYLIRSRQLGSVPAAAERLDQRHREHHLRRLQADQRLLRREQRGLLDREIDVRIEALLVAIALELERPLRELDRRALVDYLLGEQPDLRQVVLDLLERGQHGLAIARHARVVRGDRLIDRRAAQPAVEHGLGQRRADRP